MNVFARELLDAAMALPLDERAKLAAELLASMDGKADENVEAVWARELHRRAERAHSGDCSASGKRKTRIP